MSRRGDTTALVLAALHQERGIGTLLRALHTEHGISASAVREQVRRLCQAGAIERVSLGRYKRKTDGEL